MINGIISAVVGIGLGVTATVGGVNAYHGDPKPASQEQLYSYADE